MKLLIFAFVDEQLLAYSGPGSLVPPPPTFELSQLSRAAWRHQALFQLFRVVDGISPCNKPGLPGT